MSGETWHIELERSGGFAGITFNADADSSKLDPQAAADLQRLAGAVDFSRPRDGGAGVPDAFHYHIVAEHGSERPELTVGESQLDPPLKELVDWLMQRARNPRQ